MADNGNENQDTQKSYILIQFQEVGSALFGTRLENVAPVQILMVAEYLRFEAESMLTIQKARAMQEEMNKKIAVPKPNIIIGK